MRVLDLDSGMGPWQLCKNSMVEVLTSRSPSRFLDREAAYIGTQLVQGLAFLHSQGEL